MLIDEADDTPGSCAAKNNVATDWIKKQTESEVPAMMLVLAAVLRVQLLAKSESTRSIHESLFYASPIT